MLSNNISPAFETPPPITNVSGLQIQAIFAIVRPKIELNFSTTFIDNSSSSFAKSKISLAVIF